MKTSKADALKEKLAEAASNPSATDLVNEVLEQSKGKFNSIVVIGFDVEGKFDIATTLNNYPSIQYLLSKAAFEMQVHEKNNTTNSTESGE